MPAVSNSVAEKLKKLAMSHPVRVGSWNHSDEMGAGVDVGSKGTGASLHYNKKRKKLSGQIINNNKIVGGFGGLGRTKK
jgi:hypothetical protein